MAKIPVAIEQALKNYLQELSQAYHLDRVILFGSFARGAVERDSDIDLAIFSTDVTDNNRREVMADCWLRSIPYKIDLQPLVFPLADFEADNDFIQKEIISQGVELPIPKS